MPFPSTLSSFPRPTSNDRLNSPSHSALHNTVSSALGQVEAVIGVEGNASVVGTLQYLIKSPASNGGGHVQTANKGGTGQTSYTKGDLLVAQSTSVLTKQSIGPDGTGLVADSTTATGIRWATITSPKVAISGSVFTVADNVGETSIISTTIPGSTLGTNGAIRARVFITDMQNVGGLGTLTIRGIYGNSSIGTIVVTPASAGTNQGSVRGVIEMNLIGANSPSSQIGILQNDLYGPAPYNPARSVLGGKVFASAPSNIDSGASQRFGITTKWSGSNQTDSFVVTGAVIDKLI